MVSLHTCLIVAALAAPADVEVVKFTASWCAPCKAMEPVLEQVAQRGFSVRRIDVDERRDLAAQYQVKSVPTLLIVSGGRVVDRIEGAMPLEPLLARLGRVANAPAGPAAPNRMAATRTSGVQQEAPRRPAPQPPTAHVRHNSNVRHNSPSSIEQLALQATVRLRVEDPNGHSFGTGTIVDVHGQDALVLTCGHIFRDSQGKGKIVVDLFAPGATGPVTGELIGFDLKRDLALVGLRTTVPISPISVAGPDARVAPGQQLFSVGCNHGENPTVMRGNLKAVNKYLGPENLTVEGRPTEGRSGGGLFSYDGRLIGVCNAADPEIEEGLYAAFASIHQHLDQSKLSFVYRGSPNPNPNANLQLASRSAAASPGGAVAARHESSPPDAWSSTSSRSASPFPTSLASAAAGSNELGDAEIICIIRTRDQPTAKSQVVVINRPSRDFLNQLNEERRLQADRQMTQMRVAPTR